MEVSSLKKLYSFKEVLGEPESLFMLFDDLISFDHLKSEAVVISNVHLEKKFRQEKAI